MAELDGVPVSTQDLQALALANYGHFTSMRVDDHHVRGLGRHLDRLRHDSRVLFGVDLDREQVLDYVRHAVGTRPGSFVVRVTVFDPGLDVVRPAAAAHPKVLVTTRSAPESTPPPLRLGSVRFNRDVAQIKHVGIFGSLLRRREAQLTGFDDALFVDADSLVCEGPTWNIGFFDGERVVWPDSAALPGVTMQLLQEAHEPTVVEPVSLARALRMEAAFVTSTSVGVRPVTSIDDVQLAGDHPFLESLSKEYLAIQPERL